jgi:hypothetical protein
MLKRKASQSSSTFSYNNKRRKPNGYLQQDFVDLERKLSKQQEQEQKQLAQRYQQERKQLERKHRQEQRQLMALQQQQNKKAMQQKRKLAQHLKQRNMKRQKQKQQGIDPYLYLRAGDMPDDDDDDDQFQRLNFDLIRM